MKTKRKNTKRLIYFLAFWLMFSSAAAQNFDQTVRTPDGKYGLITLSDDNIVDNVFHITISVQWVDKNLAPVEEHDALLGLNSTRFKISHPYDVKCTSFEGNELKTFNEKLELSFSINENFGGGTLSFEPDFVYLNEKEKTKGSQELTFKLPSKITFQKVVQSGEVVVLDKNPPVITITSNPELARGFKPVYDVSMVNIAGTVTDESAIKSFMVNGQIYSLSSSGQFNVGVSLVEGENRINVVAIDERGNKAQESYYVNYAPQVVATEEIIKADTLTGEGFGKYYALIIGESEYQDPNINSLDKPVKDAGKLYDVLTSKYTFDPENVKFLKNASRAEIIDVLDGYASILTDKDNLLIFYAGHGFWDENKKLGYWIPSDAREKSAASWVRNTTVQSYIKAIPTQHTLLIADACFSGGIFKTRRAFADASKGINKLYELPSRKAMTSGTLKEVPDESVFLKMLVKRLQRNEVKYISSESLFASFKEAVLNNSPNVPQYGTIQGSGDEGGDFIFIKREEK